MLNDATMHALFVKNKNQRRELSEQLEAEQQRECYLRSTHNIKHTAGEAYAVINEKTALAAADNDRQYLLLLLEDLLEHSVKFLDDLSAESVLAMQEVVLLLGLEALYMVLTSTDTICNSNSSRSRSCSNSSWSNFAPLLLCCILNTTSGAV